MIGSCEKCNYRTDDVSGQAELYSVIISDGGAVTRTPNGTSSDMRTEIECPNGHVNSIRINRDS